MKVGTVCYATSRGLGHLAHDFYLNNVVTDVCVIRHSGVPTNEDWYPLAPKTDIKRINKSLLRAFAKSMDIMLFFETPFDWSLVDYCRQNKIKTALITMYECTPKNIPYKPDLFICPSLLDMKYFPDHSIFLPLPVTATWKKRDTANHFIHNGGYLGLRGREGTTLLIEAMQYVTSPIRLTIRVQENVSEKHQEMMLKDSRIEYIPKTIPFEELYSTGDVCVQPQKFNGCSLPLQEAYASGLLVMTTDRFPMNSWLPNEPMIPVTRYDKASIGGAYLEFEEAVIDPVSIAVTIDWWYKKNISDFSYKGKTWGEQHSWPALKSRYVETLESLVKS